jgi:PHD/YefM family antitoxin component YafN of YafNO toxin-antitoxin module
MKRTNALKMRRALGKVLRELERNGEPILVERDRRPTAVLISIRDYQERFVDQVAAAERRQLITEILALRKSAHKRRPSAVALLRGLRGPLP